MSKHQKYFLLYFASRNNMREVLLNLKEVQRYGQLAQFHCMLHLQAGVKI